MARFISHRDPPPATALRLYRRSTVTRTLIYLGLAGAAAVAALGVEAVARGHLPRELEGATRLYGRPMVLAVGHRAEASDVAGYLDGLGYRASRRGLVLPGEYRLSAYEWQIGRRAFRHIDRVEPAEVFTLDIGWNGDIWSVRGADGARHDYVVLEAPLLRVLGADGKDRLPVPIDQMPQHLINAILAVEDQRFYNHQGIDIARIAGAALANIRSGRVTQGASTVTQQLVKNLHLSPARTPLRKIREMAMALVIELRYSKEDILEAYLNEVYLGQDGGLGIHGVGRAAQFYFGKDVAALTLPESALLAGIIRGPNLYAPFRHPERARERRDLALGAMANLGLIDDETSDEMRRRPLGLRPGPTSTPVGRHFVDYVVAGLTAEHGRAIRGGHAVFTTLDVVLQAAAERVVAGELRTLERTHPDSHTDDTRIEVALVALDPRTGEVLAMVGSRDYARSQFNRATHARRQPGSAFKPIVALAALTNPEARFTLASRLDDSPLSVTTPTGTWQPLNYDGRFRGSVSLREALQRSLNVPFARLGLAVGPERIVNTARSIGLDGPLTAVPSIALGSNEVTPLELARGYAALANGGRRVDAHTTLAVLAPTGSVLSRMDPSAAWAASPAASFLVTSALRGVVSEGTGQGLRRFGFYGDVAAKSGTSNGYRDAWFVGYTPTIAIAVWVGFDDGRSLGLPGARAALPIFARLLIAAKGRYGDAEFSVPDGVESVLIDPTTGLRGGPGCWGERELFLTGTAPVESCSPYEWSGRRTRRTDLSEALERLRRRLSRERN